MTVAHDVSGASTRERLFGELIASEEASLRRMLRSYERDPGLCEELYQEVCLAVWRALPRYRGDASPRTFAYRIAHNRAVSHVVGQRRRAAVSQPWEQVDTAPAATGRGPHGELLGKERRRTIESAVAELPLGLKQAVLLRLEGLSHAEIAEVLGISENASAIRLSRAASRMRSLMDAGTTGRGQTTGAGSGSRRGERS